MIPVAIWAQHVSDALPDLSASTLSVRLAQLVDSYVFYLWHFVVPINLFPHYPSYSAIGIPGMTTLGESLVVLLLVWYASWCYRHEHLAACLAVCWFLVVFFPVSGWMQIGTHRMADRYAYLPLVSLCGLAAICLAEIIQRCRWMLVVVMAMIMMMAVLSSRQVAHWQSDRSLWEYAQREQTDNALASSNLAGVYLQLGETDKAVQLLQQAADREPHVKTHVMAWIDICMMLKRWPCVDQAIEVGLQRFPEDKRFVIRAGDADMLQQRWVLAEQQYRAALGFNPANLVLYRKIGEVYVQQYRYPDAAAVLKQMVDHAEDKASAASQAAKLMELWCSQRPAGMTVQPCSQH